MNLVQKFKALQGHLNAEENELALEFLEALEAHVDEAADDSLWRNSLECGGVDNWDFYHDSLKDGGYFDDEEEDEE